MTVKYAGKFVGRASGGILAGELKTSIILVCVKVLDFGIFSIIILLIR